MRNNIKQKKEKLRIFWRQFIKLFMLSILNPVFLYMIAWLSDSEYLHHSFFYIFLLLSFAASLGGSGVILYSIVRINSILKNVGAVSFDAIKLVDPIEYKIVHELYRFPKVIQELLQSYESAHLTKYLFNLTQQFSKFYEQINILYEDDLVLKASRIRLICAIKTVLENGLKILGIDTIEHM